MSDTSQIRTRKQPREHKSFLPPVPNSRQPPPRHLGQPAPSQDLTANDDAPDIIDNERVTVTYVWQNDNVIIAKLTIGLLSILSAILVFAMLVVWLARLMPFIPVAVLSYGFLFYVAFIPLVIINLFMSCSRNIDLFVFTFFLNTFVLALAVWIVFTPLYQLIICYDGTLPLDCRSLQLEQWIILLLSGILFFLQFFIFLAYCLIVVRIRQTESVRLVTMQ
jgi:hypothetical protein